MNKKLLMLLTAMGTLSVTLIAAPIAKEVTAKLDPTFTFNVNGETTMKGSEALMYNDTLYVPVRVLSNELGAQVDYKNKTVYINTENQPTTKEANTSQALSPVQEAITIESATIKAINEESSQVTILPADKEDDFSNTIILNVSEDTALTVDGKEATLADLSTGMQVSVTHSTMMTRSLPPQTAAFSICATTTSETLPEYMLLEDVQVVEVNQTNSGYQVVVGKNESPEDPSFQTVLIVNEDTFIHHEKNKMLYTAQDLEKGMKLSVKHSPIMTLSLPGHTAAFEITILAEQ